MTRTIERQYRDPLDLVWLAAAKGLGLCVVTSADAYASTDGRGTLTIGTPETLDPDDCLAQMILHELCHGLVEGPDAFVKPDWGLDNESDKDLVKEHACLRLQWDLLRPYGLRHVLAPTTEHRAFYEALSEDSLRGSSADILMARRGRALSDRPPYRSLLSKALSQTRAIVDATPLLEETGAEVPHLFNGRGPALPRHPNGSAAGFLDKACGSCAWFFTGGRGRAVGRCHAHDGASTDEEESVCERFEVAESVDCLTCGACCREAYGAVEIGLRSPFRTKHPKLVEQGNGYLRIRREEGRCIALLVTGDSKQKRYGCEVYDDRPKTCRDFELRGIHCLTARRRVGLSR